MNLIAVLLITSVSFAIGTISPPVGVCLFVLSLAHYFRQPR